MNIKLGFVFLLGLSFCVPCGFSQPASAAPQAAPGLAGQVLPSPAPAGGAAVATPTPSDATNPAAPAGPSAQPAPQPGSPEVELVDLQRTTVVNAATSSADNRGPLVLEQELPAAVQFLAKMAGMNIQFDPSLTFTNNVPGADGKITAAPLVSVRWENISAEDALQEILDNYGLMLVMNPKTSVGRVTRKPSVAPLTTALVQLHYANPTNIIDVVKSTFVDPRAKVSADLRTSQLVIVTTEREMYSVTNLIEQLDTPTKQVLIEARLLETAKNPKSVKGIDWSGTLEAQNVTFGNGHTIGTTRTSSPGAPTTSTLPSGRTVNSTPGTSVTTELLTTLGNGGISADTARGFNPSTAFLNADGVHAVLSFLNTDNDTEVVATPRAVTVDNQTATLSVTRAFPIFEVTPGSANVASAAQVKYTNLGTILKVTPRITANSNIALKVVPEVSNIDSKDKQIINGTINEANVYAIRRMETDVVIPSGNTLVMGGLISDSSNKAYTKVPVLGDLPGIGLAFRKDSKQRNKANLIIFVTPTIISDADFRPTATAFLQTPLPDKPDVEESAWDSGKPYDWNKGKK